MDPVELQALGLYDPAAPGADDPVEVYALTR